MNKLKTHGVRDTPERSRVRGSRRALSAGTTPPRRGMLIRVRMVRRELSEEEGGKRGRGISTGKRSLRLFPFGSIGDTWGRLEKICLIVENPWESVHFDANLKVGDDPWCNVKRRLKLDRMYNIGLIWLIYILLRRSYIGREAGKKLIKYLLQFER